MLAVLIILLYFLEKGLSLQSLLQSSGSKPGQNWHREDTGGRTQGFLVPGMECLLCSLHWSEGSKGEEIKKYGREGVSVCGLPLSCSLREVPWDAQTHYWPLGHKPVTAGTQET